MLHQPYGGVGGQISDIEIQAREILRNREMLNEILAATPRNPIEQLAKDTDRDFFLSAEDAKTYGIVDEILTKPAVQAAEAEDEEN
jgi:ATP-dependent Clp protease, protease subunit